jgi:hypothetical protein
MLSVNLKTAEMFRAQDPETVIGCPDAVPVQAVI